MEGEAGRGGGVQSNSCSLKSEDITKIRKMLTNQRVSVPELP